MDAHERLHLAIETGDLEGARAALRDGPDLHDPEWVPLAQAVMEEKPEMVRLLLAAGAPPNHAGSYTHAPLFWAVFPNEGVSGWTSGKREIAELLIAGGARVPDEEGDDEGTSLHCAAEYGNEEAVRLLLAQAGGQEALAILDYIERTPLGCAVDGRSIPCARLLLEAGAEVNLVAFMVSNHHIGDPALRRAVWNADIPMVRLLLDHGADPDMPGWMWNSARLESADVSGEVGQELRALFEVPRLEKPSQSPYRGEIERQLRADLDAHGVRTRRCDVDWHRSGLGCLVQLRNQPLAAGQGVRIRGARKEQVAVGDYDFVILTREQEFLAFWTRLDAEGGLRYRCGGELPPHVAARLTPDQQFFLSSDVRNRRWRRD